MTVVIELAKNSTSLLFKALKAYCYFKQNKMQDCNELCAEIKANKPTDPVIATYLV